MYFPYFRGRQYELLALKELMTKMLITDNILPVIEPVKHLPALNNSLKAFNKANLPVALIFNPKVGNLANDDESIDRLFEKLPSQTIIPSLLLNDKGLNTLTRLQNENINREKILTIFENHDSLNIYNGLFPDIQPLYTLCPDDRSIRRTIKGNRVLFEDKFNKQNRNADYPDDEFFSDDHLYYSDDNYCGFGDYSIVGSDYNETGFAPYAVAIHIVYFDKDKILRIKHFISDSNEDISDVAGKFYEAVTKLNTWYEQGQNSQLTTGLQTLLLHYQNHTYPGLPTLKKLSIMHHLELMNNYLTGKLDS